MKNILLISLLIGLITQNVFALESLPEKKANINLSAISSVRTLKGHHQYFKLVETDYGMSTDVSPRYSMYLTFLHPEEMNNTSTVFFLGSSYIGITDVKKVGQYEYHIIHQDIDWDNNGGLITKVIKINVKQVLLDDKNLSIDDDFMDPYFSSNLKILK